MNRRPPETGRIVLTVGFATTVGMWAVGYVARLPAILLPSPLLMGLLLLTLIGGGIVVGRRTSAGPAVGAGVGALSGTVNLLVLGSFLAGDGSGLDPAAWIWVPGSVAVSSLLAAIGAGIGRRFRGTTPAYREWPSGFVRVAVGATLLLLAVGGLVTSAEAGLAVVDWPNSFGYNMFLYPFSRMTGPIYYEHAHRLLGALVGLTTLVMAIFLQRAEPRRWVRGIAWASVVMVILQGILGGVRVTGGFTLSTSPDAMAPQIGLALIHGVLAQLFFATLVALAVIVSPTFRDAGDPVPVGAARIDRSLALLLIGVTLVQLVLGATQRHLGELLLVHIVVGVAFVAPMAVHVGMRAWGLRSEFPVLRRSGLALIAGIAVQIALGFGAFAVRSKPGEAVSVFNLTISTAHQWTGALILALAVAVACWSFRLLAPAPAGSATRAASA